MTTWRLVLPVIDVDLGRSCLDSMKFEPRDWIIVVDNTRDGLGKLDGYRHFRARTNLGVAASWNVGIRQVLAHEADYLIICSQAILFGEPGGRDLVAALDSVADGYGMEVEGEAGWHLIAIGRETIERTGEFDEGFWPAYFEDTDYLYRMGLEGLPSPRENGRCWPYAAVDYIDRGHGLMLASGAVQPPFGLLAERYRKKWGGDQGSETFTEPWNGARGLKRGNP